MFKCGSLFSGSSGNSFFIQSDNINILVDVGVSAKKITEALTELEFSIEKIDAILITHEHIDHTKSLSLLSCKYNIPVYANKKTWDALSKHREKISVENIKIFNNLENFYIGDFKISPFSISHDAADPCGFNIYYNDKKISIATDIGQITEETLNCLKNSSFLFLESNYDPNILKMSSYPYILKQRISGNKGHMSNITAGKVLQQITDNNLKNVLLIHLSKENNFPELAYETVHEQLNGLSNIPNIVVAPRNKPSQIFNVS